MATGFKGTEIAISHITLVGDGSAGSMAEFEVQFTDANGLVHAHVVHKFGVTKETTPEIHAAIKSLHDALVHWTASAHYENSSTPTKVSVFRGIAESLRSSDPTDDPEDQG